MSEEILIHKVKITKQGVNIVYDDSTLSKSSDPDGVSREGKGEAKPSFYEAMNALLDDVVNICLLNTDGWDEAEVTGVTLKHEDNGDIGCVITAQNKSPDIPSPIIINTPYLKPSLVPEELRVKLEIVQKEARLYLDGKRSQASLFDQLQEQIS